MRDSNVANAAKESAQAKFSHGLQELSIEWRKERAGRNFNRFRPNLPSDAT
jgi:hypothetical protein